MGGQSDVGGQFNIGIFITGGDQNNILYNIVQNTLSVGICIGATNNLVEANLVQNNRDGIVIADTASSPNTGGCEILSDFAPNWLFGVGGETVAPSRGD